MQGNVSWYSFPFHFHFIAYSMLEYGLSGCVFIDSFVTCVSAHPFTKSSFHFLLLIFPFMLSRRPSSGVSLCYTMSTFCFLASLILQLSVYTVGHHFFLRHFLPVWSFPFRFSSCLSLFCLPPSFYLFFDYLSPSLFSFSFCLSLFLSFALSFFHPVLLSSCLSFILSFFLSFILSFLYSFFPLFFLSSWCTFTILHSVAPIPSRSNFFPLRCHLFPFTSTMARVDVSGSCWWSVLRLFSLLSPIIVCFTSFPGRFLCLSFMTQRRLPPAKPAFPPSQSVIKMVSVF